MTVNINDTNVKMSREEFNVLMKTTYFQFDNTNQKEGDHIPNGFYLVDGKTRECKWVFGFNVSVSAIEIKVADRKFKVNQPWKGYTYA
jgi:hypothetical protein